MSKHCPRNRKLGFRIDVFNTFDFSISMSTTPCVSSWPITAKSPVAILNLLQLYIGLPQICLMSLRKRMKHLLSVINLGIAYTVTSISLLYFGMGLARKNKKVNTEVLLSLQKVIFSCALRCYQTTHSMTKSTQWFELSAKTTYIFIESYSTV